MSTDDAEVQEAPLKEAGDPLETAGKSPEELEEVDPKSLSSVEKLVLHGAHMGF